MNFRTEINIPKNKNLIDYNSKIVLLGSCFSDSIGKKFHYFKFNTTINPFGVIFNPVSLEKLILRCLNNQKFSKQDFILYNEKWQSLDLHSQLAQTDLDSAILIANQQLRQTKKQLLEASHIYITLGTSWVYRYLKKDEIVANCHKIPQTKFKKELLSVTTVKNSLQTIIKNIKKSNEYAVITLTVSPVRHVKDGFTENNLSKSHLISAVHSVTNNKDILYFPSYEIVMDDLRDYRFYKSDMLHPNQIAIDYIWRKLQNSSIKESVYTTMKKVASIQKRLQHKPFNPNTKKHQDFLKKLEQDKLELKKTTNIFF
ncbi:MAG TPA: GSCFA domain-containing protein [Flavobacteriia bacterium]|jgi:lysophospholipase L1-like esterase/ribosomal protein L33|nr:GSCFA domain-containing protein [Flavobacteriia bacterium]